MSDRNEALEHVLGFVLGQLIVAGYPDEILHDAIDQARDAIEAARRHSEAEDE